MISWYPEINYSTLIIQFTDYSKPIRSCNAPNYPDILTLIIGFLLSSWWYPGVKGTVISGRSLHRWISCLEQKPCRLGWQKSVVRAEKRLCYQWKFQDPKMEVLHHIRPYLGDIYIYIYLHGPYIGLIYGRYLQFRFLKWLLMIGKMVATSGGHCSCWLLLTHFTSNLFKQFIDLPFWSVVSNIFSCSIYWECHHPNWRTHIFQDDKNHQPVQI